MEIPIFVYHISTKKMQMIKQFTIVNYFSQNVNGEHTISLKMNEQFNILIYIWKNYKKRHTDCSNLPSINLTAAMANGKQIFNKNFKNLQDILKEHFFNLMNYYN